MCCEWVFLFGVIHSCFSKREKQCNGRDFGPEESRSRASAPQGRMQPFLPGHSSPAFSSLFPHGSDCLTMGRSPWLMTRTAHTGKATLTWTLGTRRLKIKIIELHIVRPKERTLKCYYKKFLWGANFCPRNSGCDDWQWHPNCLVNP